MSRCAQVPAAPVLVPFSPAPAHASAPNTTVFLYHCSCLAVTVFHSQVQWSVALRIRSIDIRACAQQHAQARAVTATGREMHSG